MTEGMKATTASFDTSCPDKASKSASKVNPKTVDQENITEATIYECIAAPHPRDIRLIRDTLLTTSDVTSCLLTINELKTNKGLALADILTNLAEQLNDLDVPAQTRVTWLEGLAEIEYRLSGGGSETVQTGGLVGVIRNGAELILNKSEKISTKLH